MDSKEVTSIERFRGSGRDVTLLSSSFVRSIAVCVIVFIIMGRENGELNWNCGSDEMSSGTTFIPSSHGNVRS